MSIVDPRRPLCSYTCLHIPWLVLPSPLFSIDFALATVLHGLSYPTFHKPVHRTGLKPSCYNEHSRSTYSINAMYDFVIIFLFNFFDSSCTRSSYNVPNVINSTKCLFHNPLSFGASRKFITISLIVLFLSGVAISPFPQTKTWLVSKTKITLVRQGDLSRSG